MMGWTASTIFLGSTPAEFRDYLIQAFGYLRGDYDRIIVPCAGSLTIPALAVRAGWKPEQIECSDISLYTSVVGMYASGADFRELGVRLTVPALGLAEGERIQNPEDALLLLKYLSIPGKNTYERSFLREIEYDKEAHRQGIKRQLELVRAELEGVRYDVGDMWDVLERCSGDRKSVIYVAPPSYAHGYTRMFDTQGRLTWNAPTVAEFDPKTGLKRLFEVLRDAEAFGLVYRYKDIDEEEANYTVFAKRFAPDRTDYLLAGRPEELRDRNIALRRTRICPADAPTFTAEQTITENSKIQFAKAPEEVAMYYRDLFAHRLGTVETERNFILLVDGRVAGVIGIHLFNVMMGTSGQAFLLYGFTAPTRRYPRLNKLLMMTLVTKDFAAVIEETENLKTRELTGLKTTCLSRYPEMKSHRGVLKLEKRERKNGTYRLVYATDFKEMSFRDCLITWLKRENGRAQQDGARSGQTRARA